MARQRPGQPSAAQQCVGWREWLSLPELGIGWIKAKVDTGARTSCLHAFDVQAFTERGAPWVRFSMHPIQGNDQQVVICQAPVADHRLVTDSGGHREMRYVIESRLELGGQSWSSELTLANRDTMRFRMLLGRKALEGRFLVDCGAAYLQGRPPLTVRRPA